MWVSSFPERVEGEFPEGDPRGPKIPLTIIECLSCGVAQLSHTVPRDLLYRDYWYRSGMNESMQVQLQEIVADARTRVKLIESDAVLDIGANDGTLLAAWGMWEAHPSRIGVDPAVNLQSELRAHAEMLLPDYWPLKVYDGPRCKVITSIAMFYDLERPQDFVREIKRVLTPKGVWCLQLTDLASMLMANAFDGICHEHLFYYRIFDLANLLRSYDLSIADLSYNSTNGGSVRLWVKHAGEVGEFPEVVARALAQEEQKIDESGGWLGLATRVGQQKARLESLIEQAPALVLYGASTKGNTLLQHYRIGGEGSGYWHTRFAAERAPGKWGRFTVTGVPIVPEAWAREVTPEGALVLVLPWHFADAILEREQGKWAKGVKFVFPLPEVRVAGQIDQ
jgi:SAM-dependent methyltransferase